MWRRRLTPSANRCLLSLSPDLPSTQGESFVPMFYRLDERPRDFRDVGSDHCGQVPHVGPRYGTRPVVQAPSGLFSFEVWRTDKIDLSHRALSLPITGFVRRLNGAAIGNVAELHSEAFSAHPPPLAPSHPS
jgi:hypothetical protein